MEGADETIVMLNMLVDELQAKCKHLHARKKELKLQLNSHKRVRVSLCEEHRIAKDLLEQQHLDDQVWIGALEKKLVDQETEFFRRYRELQNERDRAYAMIKRVKEAVE